MSPYLVILILEFFPARLATQPHWLDLNTTQLLANLLPKPSVFYYLSIVPCNLVSIKSLLLLLLTHPPLKQYITWTRTTQCTTAQTHTPHCLQEDQACSISRWCRTVYIPWLDASYDRHKGKHWLNSYNRPNHRG